MCDAPAVEDARLGRDAAPRPLISVALCTWNGAGYLREQLDSLLAQDYRPFEIVAVDDASTDDTLAILRDYRERGWPIRIESNERNLGITRNFDRALRLCRGELIAPCDQDDIWSPDKLSTLFACLGNRSMAYCDSELIDAQGRSLGRCMSALWKMGDLEDPLALIFINCVSGHALLMRRELLQRALPIRDEFMHDWWLAMVAAADGGIAYCPRPLVRYRRHRAAATCVPGSAEARRRRREQCHGTGMRKHAAVEARLEALQRLPGEHRELGLRLLGLWRAHAAQWVSPALCLLCARQGARLYRLRRKPAWKRWLVMHHLFWGLRLKRVLEPRRYGKVPIR